MNSTKKTQATLHQKLPKVSIIIVDYKKKNPYLVECLDAIQNQTYKNFEIILVCDYPVTLSSSRRRGSIPSLRQKSYGHYVGPAEKRDVGAKMAKGEILAFIDDDAFPSPDWLAKIVPHLKNKDIAGVGGPGITPTNVSWQEQSSGWASASPAGAGNYTYRFLPGKMQFVDDYPSMNLAVRKTDFDRVGGFDSNFWPGEDTKLCLDLTHKLGKKIIYEPKAIVYHHRRPIWKGHLMQNGNFGLHRGFFARILPETSLKLIYFAPSFLLLGLIYLLFLSKLNQPPFNYLHSYGWLALKLYFLLLTLNSLWIFSIIARSETTWQSSTSTSLHSVIPGLTRNPSNKVQSAILQSLISIPVIFVTHLWYGTRFLQGFLFTEKLSR